jgi:microcystin-dependent protein
MYGGETVPSGWYECDGSTASRTVDTPLFFAIGTAWGEGDGSTTFNKPDFRGVFARGWNHGASTDTYHGDQDAVSRSTGTAGGNSGDNVGSYQNDMLRSHIHSVGQIGLGTGQISGGSNLWGSSTTGATGGDETRPKNAYVMYIIKR